MTSSADAVAIGVRQRDDAIGPALGDEEDAIRRDGHEARSREALGEDRCGIALGHASSARPPGPASKFTPRNGSSWPGRSRSRRRASERRRSRTARGSGRGACRDQASGSALRLEVAAPGLLDLDRLEERLEVADAEAARAVALDDLEEEGRPILHRAGEDLEQDSPPRRGRPRCRAPRACPSARPRRRPGRAATRSRRAACRGTRRRARAGRGRCPRCPRFAARRAGCPASR